MMCQYLEFPTNLPVVLMKEQGLNYFFVSRIHYDDIKKEKFACVATFIDYQCMPLFPKGLWFVERRFRMIISFYWPNC